MAKQEPKPLEADSDPILNWRMPEIHIGEEVQWFSDASGNETNANLGRVVRVMLRAIDIVVTREDGLQRLVNNVHYIDDPMLEQNQHWIQNGGWRLSTTTRRLKDIEARLAALEELATKK